MRFSDAFIDDLRDRLPISEVVGTRVSWDRKKTKPNRGDWWGCCPFHGENSPSFHCEDRKGRYHCFGCGASGDHFRFFMELDGVAFPRAVEMVAGLAGVSVPGSAPETERERHNREHRARERAVSEAQRRDQDERERAEKIETVRGIWAGGAAVAGTLAEKYLIGRGIPMMAWPPSLRFHPNLRLNNLRHPALICGVQDKDRKLVAVWRIFLDGSGKALVGQDGRKMKLGLGPAGGGAVRLSASGPEILVCEGVETGFGVGCLTGWRKPVWPLLSTSGMVAWEPPDGVQAVTIYSDGDRYKVRPDGKIGEPPGRMAANKLKAKLISMGIKVTVQEPPAGTDWLDVWVGLQAEEGRVRDVQYLTD